MSTWNCLHLYADADGVSRLDHDYTLSLSPLEFAPPAPPVYVARAPTASALVFVELPIGWRGGWHPSPSEQWVFCLQGEMGYETGDGHNFTLQAGSRILTTDTQGRGHKSWNAGDVPVHLALVQI